MTNHHEHTSTLQEILASSEPSYDTTGPELRRKAQSLRRRRLLASGAAGVLVAGVAVGAGWAAHQLQDDRAPVASQATAGFDPEALASSLSDAVRAEVPAAKGSRVGEPQVQALDAQSNPITGPDRDKASLWTVDLDIAPTDRLEVRLVNETTTIEVETRSCERELDGGLSLSCDVARSGDMVVVSQVRGVRRQDGAWPIVFTKDLDSVGSDSLWFQRRVKATSPEGSAISVNEYVKASDLASAEASWTLSPQSMTDLATNGSLTFPEAAPGADGCDWVVPAEAAAFSCGEPRD